MQIYAAPMEGITGYTWRNVHHRLFTGIDRYYAPFVVANQTLNFKTKEKKDVAPANNTDICMIPQIMANKADEFIWAAGYLHDLGYEEVNLNLGCPMATVVSKKKGSGFLAYPDEMDAFLDKIYEGCQDGPAISIKTRIGRDDDSLAVRLMEIYNKYPVKELTIHPRTRVDLYKGEPRMEVFRECMKVTRHPVCYNGNVFCAEDYRKISELALKYPNLQAVMLGRGLIANPALARECKGGTPLNKEEMAIYQKTIWQAYDELKMGDGTTMHRMKELWFYMGDMFPGAEREVLNVKKAKNSAQYLTAAEKVLKNCEMTGKFLGRP